VPLAPTIFVALEEQLGVKLEPAQTPREFIVIDAVERPSPNRERVAELLDVGRNPPTTAEI
jgi:hypothetical protein